MLRGRILAGLTLCTLIAACGSNDAPVDPAATAAAPVVPNPNAEFIAAVPVGNNAAPVRAQFRIGVRPSVGEALPVEVRVVPTADVDKLQASFEAEPGLEIVDPAKSSFVLDGMKSGTAHAHELGLKPAQDGVFLLKVTVMTDQGGGSKLSEFAIPILVASPSPPAAPAPSPAPPAATAG